MALDAYSLCPAGTGKKVKFCCPDLQPELEKIDRMIEGEQYIATLQHIDQLEKKGQQRACLKAIKAELLRVTDQFDAARPYVDDFLQRFPENPVAWAEAALLTALHEDGKAAMVKLQRSLVLCQGRINGRIYEAMEVVANALLEEGHVVAGRALLHLLNALDPKDRHVVDRILHFNRATNVPLMLKTDAGMMPCPADVPWRAKFDAAMEQAKHIQWQETANRLADLAAEIPDSPAIWNNLARIRSWLGDEAGASEALRRYAALYGGPQEVSLEDAVEAEATAMLLSPVPLGDATDALRWVWPVSDAERLHELLLSDRRIISMPMDPSNWPVNDSPPPRMVGAILDRPSLGNDEEYTRDKIPHLLGQLLLFGRETDRAARLEIVGVARPDSERMTAILREIGGDTFESAPEETVMGKLSASREMLMPRWMPPMNASRERIDALFKEEFCDAVLNRWPDLPLGALDGRTLRQAAGDAVMRIKALAVILVADETLEHPRTSFDFNELRSQLGQPRLEPIDARHCKVLDLPLVRMARVDVASLNDEDLERCFHRASIFNARDAAQKFAREIVARPAFVARPERIEAYRVLIEAAENLSEALKTIDEARNFTLSLKQSCAAWDLMELPFRFAEHNAPEAMRLMRHIESRHLNEAGVAQTYTRVLINAGLLNPDGTPVAMPGGQPGGQEMATAAAEPGKLWTPGSESSSAGGGKLWTPGG